MHEQWIVEEGRNNKQYMKGQNKDRENEYHYNESYHSIVPNVFAFLHNLSHATLSASRRGSVNGPLNFTVEAQRFRLRFSAL